MGLMDDVFGFDLVDGLASGRCPICHALAADERRWLDSFRREGRRDPATRRRFFAAGGFCSRHAWLLHGLVADAEGGAAIADVYGALADRDLAESIMPSAARERPRTRGMLRRTGECPACLAAADALDRKTHFFRELLGGSAGRERYERSAALCLPHLRSAIAAAGREDETSTYLLRDWRRRLDAVREQLADVCRWRDEDGPCSQVIRLYVGDGSVRGAR